MKSVPFDTYIIMATLALFHIRLPAPVTDFAGIIANSNAFMAMLMLGVGFKISGNRKQFGSIVKILAVRYGVAILVALCCFFVLPLNLESRQALTILAFAPIASAAPAFTTELDGNAGLSSAINSISIVISIVCMVVVLILIL